MPMAQEQVPDHLNGLMGFIVAHTGNVTLDPVSEMVGSVQQVFGMVIEPAFDAADKVKSLIVSLTATLEAAFTFADGRFFDPFGQVWLDWIGGPDAAPFVDLHTARIVKVPEPDNPTPLQQARTERILAAMNHYGVPCYMGSIRWIPDEETVMLRAPSDVARRIVAMHSVVTFARGRDKQSVLADIARFDVDAELSPAERALLYADPLDEAVRQQMIWRLEALVPLMWALGHIETFSWPEAMVDVDELHELVFDKVPDPAAVATAQLRPVAQILDALEVTVRQHNGLRNCYSSGDLVPANFNWNAPTDMTPPQQAIAAPLLAERHHALNWLVRFGDAGWDDVDTPT